MPGQAYDALFEVAVEQYGYATAGDARDLSFGPEHLVDLARRGDIDRIAHGLYRFRAIPTTMRDQLVEATRWPRRLGTISHASAPDLLGPLRRQPRQGAHHGAQDSPETAGGLACL